MKQIVDKQFFIYSVDAAAASGIYVKCPKCNGPGIVNRNRIVKLLKNMQQN